MDTNTSANILPPALNVYPSTAKNAARNSMQILRSFNSPLNQTSGTVTGVNSRRQIKPMPTTSVHSQRTSQVQILKRPGRFIAGVDESAEKKKARADLQMRADLFYN